MVKEHSYKKVDPVNLLDYQKPDYIITQASLEFELGHSETLVQAVYQVKRKNAEATVLRLDGEGLTLLELQLNGRILAEQEYVLGEDYLEIANVGEQATLLCKVQIHPGKNTRLSGLYASGDNLCTQCEAQGFRHIIYSLDRPDVLSVYQVTLVANPKRYPVMLANGDCVSEVQRADGRVAKTFVDPFPKPSYLFALVAGKFQHIKQDYTSTKGTVHNLYIHLPLQYELSQAQFAMQALVMSMRWDEQTFGCYYDLNEYHIVAMPDFNFGAMENKGLNIFNTSTLLARKDIATDASFFRVLTVVGHEYFHNWTGNRVTLRDWFQLSLKEGLTTYREMLFGMYAYGRVARLDYIFDLTERQFPEDQGPMAHPIQPKSYINIDNFYTATTYTKGAEVLRMMEDVIGPEKTRQGIQAYLQEYDGSAATIEDFLGMMQQQADFDHTAFIRWYHQSGTPELVVTTAHDQDENTLTITLEQQAATALAQSAYEPVLMPVSCKLYSENGQPFLPDTGVNVRQDKTWVLTLSQQKQQWVIADVPGPMVLSCLRGLSAPVKLKQELTMPQRKILIQYDDDPYIKYTHAATMWAQMLAEDKLVIDQVWLKTLLDQAIQQPALTGIVFRIPSIRTCQEVMGGFDFDTLVAQHERLVQTLATALQAQWLDIFNQCQQKLHGEYEWTQQQVDYRRLQGLCLYFLLQADGQKYEHLALQLWDESDNLTQKLAAVNALSASNSLKKESLMQQFYQQAQQHELVMDRWFVASAASKSSDPLRQITQLLEHQDCNKSRPNRIMAWFGGWLQGNFASLHAIDGSGYALLAKVVIECEALNASTASRMLRPLLQWQHYDKARQQRMISHLRSLQNECQSTAVQEQLAAGLRNGLAD